MARLKYHFLSFGEVYKVLRCHAYLISTEVSPPTKIVLYRFVREPFNVSKLLNVHLL